MLTLTQALAAALGDAARFAVEVLDIRRPGANSAQGEMQKQGFEVICREHDGSAHSIDAQAIILTTPAAPAGQLLAGIEPRFGEALSRIEYAPVAQFSSGYPLKEISPLGAIRKGEELSGFGFLVPRGEGLRLLGTVWNSSLFPERAPEGAASFTTFLGGATDPGICALSEEEIARIARTELGRILRAGNPPLAENVAVWRRAIPQYNIGHTRIVATLKALCAGCPGIFLAGNYFEGPAIPACVEQAIRVADDVEQFVSAAPGAPPAA
jgi:oxygen-dependent protoporphyrinogen oxidase